MRPLAAGAFDGRIAAGLNAVAVATAQGGRGWYSAIVSKVLIAPKIDARIERNV